MTLLLRPLLCLALLPVLAACGDRDSRYLLDAPAAATQKRAQVATVEVRDVSLPSYAADTDIVMQEEDGALRPIARAVWADDPTRGVTQALAGALGAASTATVASEPWPLEEPADARVEVRVERMVARPDNTFEIAGRYAIASRYGRLRERIERFAVSTPMASQSPGAIARAQSAAIAQLAEQIAGRL